LASQSSAAWATSAPKKAGVTMLATETLLVAGTMQGPERQPVPQYSLVVPQNPNRLQHSVAAHPQFCAAAMADAMTRSAAPRASGASFGAMVGVNEDE
jgi:hypothetical protein